MRYILWSGGFDSTYLLCRCARESDEDIQPIYIIFPEAVARGSAAKEVEAQNNLLLFMKTEPGIKAKILQPIRIEEDKLPHRKEFEDAYEKMQDDDFISRRYMYRALGRLTEEYPNLMVGIEAPPPKVDRPSTTRATLAKYGISILDDGTVQLNEDGNVDMFNIFKGLKFCMIDVSAQDELQAFRDWGYDDLVPLCRTCCTGANQACGVCAACKTKMECGDTFKTLMPRGYVNYQIKQYVESINSTYALYFTLFVWGNYNLRTGKFTTNIGRQSRDMFISQTTAANMSKWFNALLDNYPNFDKVDRAEYGIE